MAFGYSIDKRFQLATGVWVVIGNWTSGGDQTGIIECQLSYAYSGSLTYNEPATGGVAAAPAFDTSTDRFPCALADSKITIDFERNRDGTFVIYGRP